MTSGTGSVAAIHESGAQVLDLARSSGEGGSQAFGSAGGPGPRGAASRGPEPPQERSLSAPGRVVFPSGRGHAGRREACAPQRAHHRGNGGKPHWVDFCPKAVSRSCAARSGGRRRDRLLGRPRRSGHEHRCPAPDRHFGLGRPGRVSSKSGCCRTDSRGLRHAADEGPGPFASHFSLLVASNERKASSPYDSNDPDFTKPGDGQNHGEIRLPWTDQQVRPSSSRSISSWTIANRLGSSGHRQ